MGFGPTQRGPTLASYLLTLFRAKRALLVRSMHPCLYIIPNEASFLVCSMARIFYTSRMQATGERRLHLCQFIERVTFARCAYIIISIAEYHIARTDI